MKNTFKLLSFLCGISFACSVHAVEYRTNSNPKIEATFDTNSQILNAAVSNDFGSQFYLTMTTQVGADYGVRLIVDTKVNTISAYSFDGFNNKDGVYLGSTFGDIADGCNGCNNTATPWLYGKEFAIVTADLKGINDNASKLGVFKFDMGERTYVEMGRVGGTIQYQNPNCVPGSSPRPDCGQITNYGQLDMPFASGERFVDYNTSVVGGEAVSEPLPLAVMVSSMLSLMVWRKKQTKKHSI